MLPAVGWLFGPIALAAWAAALVVGAYHIASQYDRFSAASMGILAPGNWLLLGACWILLKLVHELAHGLTCKKFGGSVLECGIVFILLTPVAYVGATGAWRLRSKWQRIFTSAAGMYVELFCAAIAALVWSYSPPGMLNHVAYNVVIMAGLSTVIVNGNPLMRFDAYYMLADFLEIPNLSMRGQQYVLYLGRRYLVGIRADCPEGATRRIVKLYGMLACAWRMLVLVCLLIAAHALVAGAGLILAATAALLWLGIPALRLAHYLVVGNVSE
jgi:putative peptide zinc metalloprotease protein